MQGKVTKSRAKERTRDEESFPTSTKAKEKIRQVGSKFKKKNNNKKKEKQKRN